MELYNENHNIITLVVYKDGLIYSNPSLSFLNIPIDLLGLQYWIKANRLNHLSILPEPGGIEFNITHNSDYIVAEKDVN